MNTLHSCPLATALAFTLLAGGASAAQNLEPRSAVYAMTNAVEGNSVVVFNRRGNGTLHWSESFATGGLGTSSSLGNQGALVIDAANRCLYAANAGSDDITAFEIKASGLSFVQKIGSGGQRPISIGVDRNWLYVLNAGGSVGGSDNVSGFRVGDDCSLVAIADSTRPLSAANTSPAQASFTPDGRHLVVTEKMTDIINTYLVRGDGRLDPPRSQPSAVATPFGFAFGKRDLLLVSEAAGGTPGAGSVSSYRVNDDGALNLIQSQPTTQTATCWVVVSTDGRFAYVTNTADESLSALNVGFLGTLSLLDGNGEAGQTGTGTAPIDLSLSNDGRHVYALDNLLGTISVFRTDERSGRMTLVEVVSNQLPPGANGIVAR